MKKGVLSVLSVIIAGIWVTLSEFLRNQILFKSYWVNHFNSLGLKFQTLPINGILWVVWSFIFAYFIFLLLQKFSMIKTIGIAWLAGFVLMWITVYNLQVLPVILLIFVVPWSLIEAAVAAVIISAIRN